MFRLNSWLHTSLRCFREECYYMTQKYPFLKANEKYAQYWHRENATSKITKMPPKRHPYRSLFACDRDRVMYSYAFRSLSSKTQVFNSQSVDDLRTRLTHTLEVSQIARTIAHQLGLDEELTEAIALGHDVGHTPFGHIGERTLNNFSQGQDKKQVEENVAISKASFGFKHNLQSVRVLVEYSEDVYFSNYMLFGVREHSKPFWNSKEDVAFYDMYEPYWSISSRKKFFPAWSFEAFIVKWADEIAQRHHDIEDAFRQKIMPPDDIVEKVKPLTTIINSAEIADKYKVLEIEMEKLKKESSTIQYAFAHALSSFLVDAYVTILVNDFTKVLSQFISEYEIAGTADFLKKYLEIPVDEIRKRMELKDSPIKQTDDLLGKSLKYSILDSYKVQRMDGKGAYIIRKLIRAYISNPQQLPNEYINRFVKIELVRHFTPKQISDFLSIIEHQLVGFPQNISLWKDYECREVLRVITDNQTLFEDSYEVLLRTIFDYIASMTDSYATSQRIELY